MENISQLDIQRHFRLQKNGCATKKCDIHTDIQTDQGGRLLELQYATKKEAEKTKKTEFQSRRLAILYKK